MKRVPNTSLPPDFPKTAIVLAGGLGTRLRPAYSDRPKILAPAAGRPFLGYVLDFLASQGLNKVILSIGYLGYQVRAFAGDGGAWGLAVQYSEETTPLGTAGALARASQDLEQPFFALNGDTLFTVDFHRLWQVQQQSRCLATVALLEVPDGSARGCVRMAEGWRILSFDEKPVAAGPALVNGGVYVLEAGAVRGYALDQPVSIEQEVFPALVRQGRLAGCRLDGYFADIGTPDGLVGFEQDIRNGCLKAVSNYGGA